MTPQERRNVLSRTDRLLAASRPEEALALLSSLTPDIGEASLSIQFEHARQIGWAFGFQQQAPAALAAYTAALAVAQRMPPDERNVYLVLDTRLRWLHEAQSIPEMPAQRLVAVADAALAEASDDPDLRRKALMGRADALHHIGRLDEAWADIERLLAESTDLTPEERSNVLIDAGYRARKVGRQEIGLDLLIEASRLPAVGGRHRVRLLNALGHAWCEAGNLEEAWLCARELWDIAPPHGRNAHVAACGLLVEVAVPLGRLAEAQEAADLHLKLAEERGIEDLTLLYALIDQIDVAGAKGDPATVTRMAERAVPLAARLDRNTGTREQQDLVEQRVGRWSF